MVVNINGNVILMLHLSYDILPQWNIIQNKKNKSCPILFAVKNPVCGVFLFNVSQPPEAGNCTYWIYTLANEKCEQFDFSCEYDYEGDRYVRFKQ